MINKFFSIISVVRNNENTIQKMINSVKNQSFKNYEHVICKSDKSIDNTNNILELQNDSKLKIIKEEKKNKNRYSALNTAIKYSEGKFIILLHGDDFLFNKNILEDIYQIIIKEENKHIFYCGIKFINTKNKIVREWSPPDIEKIKLHNIWMIPHTGLVLRKSFLKNNIYYNTHYNISSDLDYILKLQKKYSQYFFKINIFMTIMLNTGDSSKLSNAIEQSVQDFQILKKYFGFKAIFHLILKKINKITQFL